MTALPKGRSAGRPGFDADKAHAPIAALLLKVSHPDREVTLSIDGVTDAFLETHFRAPAAFSNGCGRRRARYPRKARRASQVVATEPRSKLARRALWPRAARAGLPATCWQPACTARCWPMRMRELW
jgi:hypothetical protein